MVAAGCVGPRNMAHDPRHGRLHFNTWPGWNTGHRRAENAGVSSVQFPFHSRFSFMYVPENFHKLAGSRVVIVNAMQVVSVHLCFPSTFPACIVYLCRDFSPENDGLYLFRAEIQTKAVQKPLSKWRWRWWSSLSVSGFYDGSCHKPVAVMPFRDFPAQTFIFSSFYSSVFLVNHKPKSFDKFYDKRYTKIQGL